MAEDRYDKMRDELMAMTMKQLRALAKDEGVCLGYDGARKDTAARAIITHRRHVEMEAGR